MNKLSFAFTLLIGASCFAQSNKPELLTLKCHNDDSTSSLLAVVQSSNGHPSGMIESISLNTSSGEFELVLGQFDKNDMVKYDGNELQSTTFKKTLKVDEDGDVGEYKEEARFGVQEIGNTIVGYLYYKTEIYEGEIETLLVCDRVTKKANKK